MTIFLITIGVIAIFIIIFMISGYIFYRIAIIRNTKSFLKQKDTTRLSDWTTSSHEWLSNQVIDEWSLKSRDGLMLKAYKLSQIEEKKRFAVIVHGYTGQYQDMAELAHLFYDSYGFNVVMPNLRGHGSSEGHYIGMGYPDRLDILAWIEELVSLYGSDIEIVLLGVSMGGATVSFLSGEELPPQVKFIISDCAFNSIKGILAYQMKQMYPIPRFPLLYFASRVTKLLAGYSFEDKKISNFVKRSTVPMVFIHGGNDKFVPTKMVHSLYDACQTDKHLLIVNDATHGMAYRTDPVAYSDLIETAINKYITVI